MIEKREFDRLPVSGEYDVVVVGGGPAGFSAGFSASSHGMKTLIVEQFNSLGGVGGAGGHGCLARFEPWGQKDRIVGGMVWEATQRMVRAGGADIVAGHAVFFDVETFKKVLEEMAEHYGCGLLYYTQFADVYVENGKIAGLVIQNKTGRSVIKAAVYVDASGDADVAAAAGAPFDYGDDDGICQPMTLMFTLGGVDWPKVCEFRSKYSPKLTEIWKIAQDNKDMRPFQKEIMGWWHTDTRPDQLGVNFTHINFVSALKAEDLTAATLEGRKQVYETIEVYRKYIPGMEKCYLISTPATIGIRESRRIIGQYVLTVEDVKEMREFPDSIGYGSSFIDVHGKNGPGMASETWYPPAGFKYQLPYRILLPQKIENLLVAGRCVSVTHEALGSVRFIVQCAVTGEAAGTAAALAVKNNIPPAHVDCCKLRETLAAQGCIV